MKRTTLCYLEKEGSYLMLYRNRKKNDPNAGKWVGVGGKIEDGETADACMKREVNEETGLMVHQYHFYGVIEFRSDCYEDEDMYLYSCSDFSGTLSEECNEGDLAWVAKDKVLQLPIWEGDRYFLTKMVEGTDMFSLRLIYRGDSLVECVTL